MALGFDAIHLRDIWRQIGSQGFWKLCAILFAVTNLKHLPFAWHIRLINGLFTHWSTSKPLLSKASGSSALFQPMIISSRAQLLECDYNFHKSNSTYFADFDVGRLHLLMCLCKRGMIKTGQELFNENGCKGTKKIWISLGGVSCSFRREIKPYQAFEVWTRILCWDRKWIYVVSHFVQKGIGKPESYTLQPWKRAKGSAQSKGGNEQRASAAGESRPNPAVFATGIAKYVFKRERLTIPPERILQNSGLLPPKPSNLSTPLANDSPAVPLEGTAIPTGVATTVQDLTSTGAEDIIDAALSVKPSEMEWSWDDIEQERLRGMKIAEAWSKTDALNEEWTGDERPALGRYWDIP
ncbi:MAG: hypothetical protein LQ342_004804 [Letrouitia transgressa]|nr:MAG: hypothetical protein LQ342_004804 [Letrouitia transgressa]